MQNERKFYTLTDAEFAFMAAVAVITLILTYMAIRVVAGVPLGWT